MRGGREREIKLKAGREGRSTLDRVQSVGIRDPYYQQPVVRRHTKSAIEYR